MILSELHLSVFGTEMISSDKRSIYILDTLYLIHFGKKMSGHRYGIRISESHVDPNPLMVERPDPDPDLYVFGDDSLIACGSSCKPNIYVSWSTSELRVNLAP